MTLAVLVEKFAAIVVDTGGKSGLPWIASHTPPSPSLVVYTNMYSSIGSRYTPAAPHIGGA
jgi:hypothetical protein